MNRRSLLALLGAATVAPGGAGIKEAAAALGLKDAQVLGSGLSTAEVAGACSASPHIPSWWGSPLQIMLEAKERTVHEMTMGKPYPHMKSWGHAFRSMAAERDNVIRMAYRQRMGDDYDFRERAFQMLGIKV